MPRGESNDWQRIAHECARPSAEGGLSPQDGCALEDRVSADENDVDARVRLAGFYFLRLAPENHRRRAEHLAWLAEHRPDIGLGGYGYIDEEQAPEGHEATRRAWIAAATDTDVDVRVLENAATFLGFNRPEQAESILRRAAAMEPQNGRWRQRTAETLLKRAGWAEDPNARRRHARAALAELEAALALTTEHLVAIGIQIRLAEAAVVAEDWKRIRETAERALLDNETCERTFQYGNAIHRLNIALGSAALAADDLAAASEYLARAGKTPGSPQLNSFGPDLDLARALLARGERNAVLTYLADCARFWKGREALLEEARGAIERGEPAAVFVPDDSDSDEE